MKELDKQYRAHAKSFCVYVRQLILLNDCITFMNTNISPRTVRAANGEGGFKLRAKNLFNEKSYVLKKEKVQLRFAKETKLHVKKYEDFLKVIETVEGPEYNSCYHKEDFLEILECDESLQERLKKGWEMREQNEAAN